MCEGGAAGGQRQRFINVIGWNPFSLLGDRLTEVSDEFSASIILAVGTKVAEAGSRCGGSPGHSHEALTHRHLWVHFGWRRGEHSNSSAGVAIGLPRRFFRRKDIVRVAAPPRSMQAQG